jgi:hypothetical protein
MTCLSLTKYEARVILLSFSYMDGVVIEGIGTSKLNILGSNSRL